MYLGDRYENVRGAAASALGTLGDERALQSLRARLSDPDAEVARRASEALEQVERSE
jgi:HEAT repeat protein